MRPDVFLAEAGEVACAAREELAIHHVNKLHMPVANISTYSTFSKTWPLSRYALASFIRMFPLNRPSAGTRW